LHPLRYRAFGTKYYQQEWVTTTIKDMTEKFIQEINDGLTLPIAILKNNTVAKFKLDNRQTRIDWRDLGICTIDIDIDLEKVSNSFSDKEKKEFEEYNIDLQVITKELCCDEVKSYLYDFCVAFCLAYPGLFEFGSAEITLGEYKIPIGGCFSTVQEVYLQSVEQKWPEISVLSAKKVWKWINQKTNFRKGISETALDRALNALTYLFNPASYEDLLYCLMGIEAIFNSNQQYGIMEQIKTKCELLFGEIKNKKAISDMYNTRSRFIHGQLNFPSKFNPNDATDEFYKFISKDYKKTLDTASGILIASLQKYVINDASYLTTEMKLNFE